MNYLFKYRVFAESLYDALTEDAFYITMECSVFGGSHQRREAMLRYYDYSMKEARKFGRLYRPTGKAFGASIWSKPVSGELSKQMADEKKAFLKIHMGDANLAKYAQITGGMAEQTETVVPPNSWYLSIVGIAPPFQGRGLGGTLIRPILNMTDKMGLYTYLETFTPRNMSFYQRLGFQEAGAFDEPGVNARYWVMIRDPA
ncbi:GNAT family N-acetyltransferase [uncultured Desulfosarcina sp.]|uniref:GNAT family N-acetyltransferase n=1 Tax=uncultured Desulfosarcina sp. TaxID=218289 RepID=UPI0029C9859C|nr:GNAT family N-acetyltransferase [uncultured Desulfosarcina sp.]